MFVPSSQVREGQLLFVIEPEPYQASYDEAEAAVAAAKSELAAAASDLERIQLAIQSNAVSRQDLDRATAARDQADAGVRAAQARFDQATINLGYTQVRSPIAGMVSRRLVDLGNLVGASEPTVLTTVTRMDPMYVFFNAPEQFVLSALRARGAGVDEAGRDSNAVFVATAIDERFPHKGYVDFVNNTVDAATGTIEIRAVMDNSEQKLFPGLFVRVRATSRSVPNAIIVHEVSIGTDLAGKYLMVIDDQNVVDQRYVTLGPVQDDGKVVVEEGLDGSEQYIVQGLLRARPGFPVSPVPEGN
jgi:RND family efflux transporter MFP subunit